MNKNNNFNKLYLLLHLLFNKINFSFNFKLTKTRYLNPSLNKRKKNNKDLLFPRSIIVSLNKRDKILKDKNNHNKKNNKRFIIFLCMSIVFLCGFILGFFSLLFYQLNYSNSKNKK
jgi:hypothetical protein